MKNFEREEWCVWLSKPNAYAISDDSDELGYSEVKGMENAEIFSSCIAAEEFIRTREVYRGVAVRYHSLHKRDKEENEE